MTDALNHEGHEEHEGDRAELIAEYERRFRGGPVGTWATAIGGGWDTVYGELYDFREDGTGLLYGFDINNDEEPEDWTEFVWWPSSDLAIEIEAPHESGGLVEYGFRFQMPKRGDREVLVMFERGQRGFWCSPNPVTFVERS